MFERPLAWLAFAVAVAAVPVVGFALERSMSWNEIHPAVNAALNATAAVFLLLGWRAIKRREIERHKRHMLSAFGASSAFLVSYVIRFLVSGSHPYPGDGWDKALYLVILFSHMVLAATAVPMVLRTLQLGLRDDRPRHRRLARWTFPIWVYVSVTGLVVYLMLYHLAG